MKPLTTEQVKELVRQVETTSERELNCSECQSLSGEFAEKQCAGLAMDKALALMQHHLTLCPECNEEYQALEKILAESTNRSR